MSMTIQYIDVDISLGVAIGEQDNRTNRVIYRIDLANAKVRDKVAAVDHFNNASRADRSLMARLFGHELPQGGAE